MQITFNGSIESIREEIAGSGIVSGKVSRPCSNKISLIKWVRNEYSLGLKPAKDIVEHILDYQVHE